MFRILRSAALVTTSLAAGILVAPGAGYAADTTTQLSAAAMAAALKKVSSSSTTAAEKGWRATMSITGGDQPVTADYVVDPKGRVASTRIHLGSRVVATFAVAGKGMYVYLDDPTTRSAVTMIGRPKVRYAFTAKNLKWDAYVKEGTPSPASLLAEDADHAGTRTTHDDGSADYAFTADGGTAVVLHVDRAGALTSVRSRAAQGRIGLTYRYGAQHVTPPAASVTVDGATLNRAVAYLAMPAVVKGVADRAATHTRQAAGGKTVEVATLRRIVRRDAKASRKSSPVRITVSTVAKGARVGATNPWTHRTTAYSVTASGRTVLVKKG